MRLTSLLVLKGLRQTGIRWSKIPSSKFILADRIVFKHFSRMRRKCEVECAVPGVRTLQSPRQMEFFALAMFCTNSTNVREQLLTPPLPQHGKVPSLKVCEHACKQYIFQSYNTSAFNTVRFHENPLTC